MGMHLVKRLLKLDYQISVLDNLSEQVHGKDPQVLKDRDLKAVNFVLGDIREERSLSKAMKNQDIIVHLAAETGTGQSMYRISRYADVNFCGLALLLDHLVNKKHSVKKIVLASSRAVYGEGKYKCVKHGSVFPETRNERDLSRGIFELSCPFCSGKTVPQATDENSLVKPKSVYAVTKFSQEILLQTVCRSVGLPYTILRYQNVYGPGQSLLNPYTGILSIFSNRIRRSCPINIFEDGKETRDFVYIDDVIEATRLAVEKENADGETFNVGTGKPVSVLAVAHLLMKIFGKPTKLEITGEYRAGDIRHNFADIGKIKKRLGFSVKYDFDAGIKKFVEWVNSQKASGNKYESSLREMKRRGLLSK